MQGLPKARLALALVDDTLVSRYSVTYACAQPIGAANRAGTAKGGQALPSKQPSKKVDFDEYSDGYEKLLQDQLFFFSGDRSYFSRYKIETLRRFYPDGFSEILDFGAGIGLSIPHVSELFPQARITATDISQASLRYIKDKFSDVRVLGDTDVNAQKFDLILVLTVMHHVAPNLQPALMARLESMLTDNGVICIFEHNPYNPVTQRMVSTCPFDEDAILLSRKETIGLFEKHTTMKVAHSGYTLFFPELLSRLRPLERFLSPIPLGGQYFVVAERR